MGNALGDSDDPGHHRAPTGSWHLRHCTACRGCDRIDPDGGDCNMSEEKKKTQSRVVHSIICPHCQNEIFPPGGKTLVMKDTQKLRDYLNEKKYWKKARQKKKDQAMQDFLGSPQKSHDSTEAANTEQLT